MPAEQESPQQVQAPVEVPAEPEPATGAGLTDQELMQRNLPPLRGPWIRIQRDTQPLSPREEAEMQLRSIESGYSGWLGAAGIVNYRVGNPGYDQLANSRGSIRGFGAAWLQCPRRIDRKARLP